VAKLARLASRLSKTGANASVAETITHAGVVHAEMRSHCMILLSQSHFAIYSHPPRITPPNLDQKDTTQPDSVTRCFYATSAARLAPSTSRFDVDAKKTDVRMCQTECSAHPPPPPPPSRRKPSTHGLSRLVLCFGAPSVRSAVHCPNPVCRVRMNSGTADDRRGGRRLSFI